MANNVRKHMLTLTHPQLVALATQKKAMPYPDALAKTKEQLADLLWGIEGILKPVKTWEPVDNDQRVIEEPGTVEVSPMSTA
jgi:hypothetical protein